MAKLNKITFRGSIKGGKLLIECRNSMVRAIQAYDDCPVAIKIETIKELRSIYQNAYYWGVVLAVISDHTGHTPEELHDAFKKMFLPKRFVVVGKQEIELDGTTTALSTVDFSHYIDRIAAKAAELGIEVPAAQ